MRIVAILGVIAALFLIGALARPPAPNPPDGATESLSLQGYGDSNKTCQEWTDGCRTCARSRAGAPHCANIGIACQPKAVICERRDPAK